MKKILQIFLRTQLKYWWVYLLSIFTFLVAYIVNILVGFILVHSLPSMRVAHLLSTIIFTLIWSCPFIISNYQVAKRIETLFEERGIIVRTIVVHLSFMIFLFIVAFIFLGIIVQNFH